MQQQDEGEEGEEVHRYGDEDNEVKEVRKGEGDEEVGCGRGRR